MASCIAILLGLLAPAWPFEAATAQDSYNKSLERVKRTWRQIQEHAVNVKENAAIRAQAFQDCRFTLWHQPKTAKRDDLNAVRYCLCYLYWSADEYYESAVLGDFLTRHYPKHHNVRFAVQIAMISYAKLIEEASPGEDCTCEYDHLASLCQLVAERWPNTPEADESLMLLVRVAISRQNIAHLTDYLEKMSADSPWRSETELAVGQALWASYVQMQNLSADKRPSQSELQKTRSQAERILEDGVARTCKSLGEDGEASSSLASAVLALVYLCLDAGQAEQAAKWLEDARIGPCTLIKEEDPAANAADFHVETLKAAVAIYMALPCWENGQKNIVMLEKACMGAKLSQIYFALGCQFEEVWKRHRDKGDSNEATAMSKNLTFVLDRLFARPDQELDFNMRCWMAETFSALAASRDNSGGKPSSEATEYYKKAIKTYRNAMEKQPGSDSSVAANAIRMRQAHCFCRLGEYGKAMNELQEALKSQPNLLEIQREAALVYQAWGQENADCYLMAIKGGRNIEKPTNTAVSLAWGWGKIARMVQSSPSQQELFYEARYNIALCRFLYAMSKSEQNRKAFLNQSQKDILLFKRVYPEMGGKTWRAKNESLLKQIDVQLDAIAANKSAAKQ
jgi:tetratricopeptide (TPR) repeat protein